MKKIICAASVFFFLFTSCSNSTEHNKNSDTIKPGVPIAPIGEGSGVISTADYKTILSKQTIVLVDVGATWCIYCKKLAPHLDNLVNTMPGKFLLVKSDSDRDQALADSLKITSLPTLLLYKNGELQWRNEGYVDEDVIAGKISEAEKK